MVAVLIRLKLALLANAFRRSPWQVVGMALAAVYGLGLTAAALAAIPLLARQDVEFLRGYWVVGGAMAVLGWAVVPLVSGGADMTLDPRRFATFAVPQRAMLWGLGIASVVGVPGLVTVVLALANSLVWSQAAPRVIPVALGCAVLGVATCVLASRAATAVLGRVLATRFSRVAMALGVVVPLAAFVLLVSRATGSGPVQLDADLLPTIARVLAWTPIGAVWAVTTDVETGAWGVAAVRATIAAATLAGLVVLWSRGMRASAESPDDGRQGSVGGRGLGLFARVATPTGAMVARCLAYWFRDARYAAGLAIVPFIPFVLFLASGGHGVLMLSLGPFVAFVLGWAISVDVAYDGGAFWMQLANSVPGWADRWGRVLAVLVIAVPVEALAVAGSLWATGRWDATPAVVGMTLGVLLVSCGLASIMSVLFVYPVPAAGENPFTAPTGGAALNMATQLVGWLALVLCVSPLLVTGTVAVARHSTVLGLVCLALGVLGGAGAVWAGVVLGGRRLDLTGPDLMAKVVASR